ncbi:hypothetical protein JG687_00016560 [Phytophthora cactorum]|uniref:RxLR effector protein n=1 Tax=Phytophthora cactorum TaxID=29920 RepID=A0A8T1TQD9_9STRA|nr:hypothetical protein PC120_g19010 [Phytophthora cactorum]KAG3046255.1 hypothetical protein PC121_g20800 [Phytophthora cactorum]KAG4046196.1 hypothetical protein PC123_g18423 [Phytophthora cactorum]KAG6946701.1 hypothetical protein JG687_00016560 [Phytophthora cactorum]
MRLAYLFAMIIAATLHASGSALPTAQGAIQATLANVAASDIVGTDVERHLRQAEKHAAFDEKTKDEERFLTRFGNYLKKLPSKWKEDFAVKRAKEQLERSKKRRQWIREQGGTPTS